jgi:hypothetical protein
MARVRTVEFLPEIFQTPVNRQFLNATLDQLVQEPSFQKTQGYVGRKVGPGVNPVDKYVIEPTKSRNDYQLEPGVISLEKDTNNIKDAITYPGITDALTLQGAITNNADSLYASEYYTWDPFIDFDKFVNYSQYYWLPSGPLTVDISATDVPLTDNFTVTRENGVYTFSGYNGDNPPLTLVRGGNYTFQVAQNNKESVNFRVANNLTSAYVIDYQTNPTLTLVRGNTYTFTLVLDGILPFYIKTAATLGTTNLYNDGVTNNGATVGTITFTVPQTAPDTLYYVNPTQYNMRGTFNIIDATPGNGPGFWIQTDPGVNGRIPSTPNISSRDVLGVINNGEDLGTVSFNVPLSTAQNFYYTLTPIGSIPSKPAGTVDLITSLKFDEINNIFLEQFLLNNPTGIDGITSLDGKTIVFVNQSQDPDPETNGWQITTFFDPLTNAGNTVSGTGSYDSTTFAETTPITSLSNRYSVWQIQYVTTSNGVYMKLNNVLSINNLEKFSILYGTQYSSTQWYKNASGYFEQIPLLTAIKDLLFYQDGTDPEIFGQIRLIDQDKTSTLFIEDIVGHKNYTSPNGVVFTNGLKVIFRGAVEPASYQNTEYYVEGVGTAIKLLPVSNFITPETYTNSESIPYDSTPYDVGNYDATLNAPQVPDYLTINRASLDLNPWTRSNRWFHIDVIYASAAYNNTTPIVDNLLRARRPILEYRAGTRLFDFGTEGKQPINVIDLSETDALSNINGSTSYSVDGYNFVDGTRVVFAADTDPDVRNKIYQVQFIVPDTVPPLIAEPIINLTPAPDGDVLIDENLVCLSGITLQGKSFYYNGVAWISAQDKTKVNQPPLFDVYDLTGISFSDKIKYPSTTFAGSKLFSYATVTGVVVDPVLGFALKYLSLANVGDIVFDNNLYTDTFEYVSSSIGKTGNVSDGIVRQYSTRTAFTKEIGWQPAATRSISRQQFQFTYDAHPLKLDVAVDTNSVVPAIQLYVNSAFQDPNTYTYTTTSDTTTITLNAIHVPGDIIEVLVISSQVSKSGFYQIPINLENNPFNVNSPTFTLGTVRSHYQTIGENLIALQGPVIGPNNTRDLGNIVPYGLQILQQSAPLTLAGYFMRSAEFDIFASLEYNSREYIKFKSLLLETVVRNDYNNLTTAEILDAAIADITQGRTDINPFYWSDMVPTGSVYTQTVTTISAISTNVFNTVQTYNFTSSNYLGLLVYVNDVLLVRDLGYTVSVDAPRLTIDIPLSVGDVVVIKEYSNTAGSFVPNTPSKMGLYPKFEPKIFVDTDYLEPTLVIQGHDGSITMAFNDFRDQVLLEFEKRIYDNIKTDGNPIPLSAPSVIPGFFRTTDYTQAQITSILNENFLTWVGWNKVDYKTQNYISDNPFTYNYSAAGNKINGAPLLGAWRGIYRYFYDTITPNLTPWEMLGLDVKPDWWENRYGPAPYTQDNLILWDDLEAGYVADPIAPYIDPLYVRPGLTKVIPTGPEGELLSPIESVVGPYDPTAFQKSWVAGDGGPTEASWWLSSSYPFAVMRLLALTKPAEFFALFADRDLYKFDSELNQYLYNNRYRLDASGIEVYGNGVSKASYINWIVDYNRQLGRNSTKALTDDLSHLDVRLCYRAASFTDKQYLKVFVERSSPNSTNSSLLLPDDSFNLLLYKNQPFSKIVYSALIIERTFDGYAVYGYNNTTPYFNILTSSSNGLLQTVSGGGATVKVPAQYTDTITQIPYGYVFTNTTVVVDFILSYGAYLESQGLIFNDRENGYTLNWNQMATEFLYFSQQGWATGTIINLNPSATTLKAYRTNSVVDTIVSTTPENMLLDQNRVVLPTRDLIIDRDGDSFSVTSATNQAISFLNMKFTNYESMVVLDNISIFNDLVYDPTTAARQSRIRIVASTSTDWNGTLDAQGFILNQNNVKAWVPNKKYTKGEIVTYKNNYWQALNIVQPKLEFDFTDWTKSNYTKIQQGLLPNIANKADQLANSYNTNSANLERDNDLLSYGLIGFRPRQYMTDLNLDDVSQVNLYQQFLGTKGTIRAAELFTKADLGKETGAYEIFENWGVLTGSYGATANQSFIELRLNEAYLKSDPSTVQVIEPEQASQANQTILLNDVWRESYKLTSTNILPTTYATNLDTALPSAGYVNINDVDITVFNLDDPSSISAKIDTIGIGTTIWAAKSNSYNWNVYRCSETPGQLTQITDNLNSTSIAQFSTTHGLKVGDLIIIRYFDSSIDGVYRVLATPSISSVTIAYRFVNTNQTTIRGSGLVFYLQTMRVAQASDVAMLPYAKSLLPGARAYVDNNGSGQWEVLEKQEPFTNFDQLTSLPLSSDSLYGYSIAQTENLFSALVGAPGTGSDVGSIYAYRPTTNNDGYEQLIQLQLPAPDVVGYGNAIEFGQDTWAAAAASASNSNAGYVAILFRNSTTGAYTITQLLVAPDEDFSATKFGTDVAVSTDERWLYIGAPYTADGGTVYAYNRVDVEDQYITYPTDGSTATFNWSDSIVIDLANPDQLVVKVGDTIAIYNIDYTIDSNDVIFVSAPVADQIVTIARRQAVKLDDATYYGIQQNSIAGSGSGAEFTINVTRGTYVVNLTNAGSGYNIGSVLTILGTQLGGAAPANNLTVTVTNVSAGQITAFTISGSGISGTTQFDLSAHLYTATNIYSFTVLVDGSYQRPNIDYTFNPATYVLTFVTVPAPGTIISVLADTYWQYVDSIQPAGIESDAQFGFSISSATDGRQVFVGAPTDDAGDLSMAGASYVYDRSVIRYVVLDADTLTYDIPTPVTAPVSVLINNQYANIRNLTVNSNTTIQFINGTVDVDLDANTITIVDTLTIGDTIDIETNQFTSIEKIVSVTPADNSQFGFAIDSCPTNCSLYIGEPLKTTQLPQDGSVDRCVNQSRVYGVTTSLIANPSLTAGQTIRINNIEVAIPNAPNNTVAGLASAISPTGYVSTRQYYTNDRVTYNNLCYVALGSTLGNPPTNATYWVETSPVVNVSATTTPDLTFVGDGVTKIFSIGTIYSSAESYTSVVYVNNVLQTLNSDYTYNNTTGQIAFVSAPAKNSAIVVVSGKLVISVKNLNAGADFNKLSVLPGTTGTAFDNLGFTTFAYVQTLTSPKPTDYAKFGSAVHIDSSAINLVVGAPNGTIYKPVTFDGGETYFNDRSTTFFSAVFNSGVVYTYDYLPSASSSINNPGAFIFGQQIYATDILSNDQFGLAVNFTHGRLAVGAPGNDFGDSTGNYGVVSIFDNPTNKPAWAIIHKQQPVVDVNLINSVFAYDKLISKTQTYFDFFDPLQGKILGAARRNIDFIGAVDPASYNTGSVHNLGNSWGEERVGQIWWDTDTVRFINPNQDDIVYASRQWGQVFPGSRVDIYQWVSSSVPPLSYTGAGTPLSTTSYTVKSSLNQDSILVTTYYFWVRGINTINSAAGKTLSTTGIARYIENPRASGIPYIAALNSSTIAIYNGLEYISAADTILHINFDQELNSDNIHTEYKLIADGQADSFLSPTLYRKLQDSFCGVDTRGGIVPDPLLSPAERYGVQFRPRQSMFVNRYAALQNYLQRANTILAQYPIVETKNLDLLNSAEPIPTASSGAWDTQVANLEELSYQDIYAVPLGYLYLVDSISTQNGFWGIYEVTESAIVTGERTLELTRIQNYDTRLYWNTINWFLPGYNSTVQPIAEVPNYSALSTLNLLAAPIGSSVKVTANAQGKWEIYLRSDLGWERVGLQNGTIQFKEELWNYAAGNFGFDAEVYDAQYFDQEPVIETRKIIQAINEELFVDELAIVRNQLLILMFNYIYSEEVAPNWLIKTSLVDVNHKIRALLPFQTYLQDNQTFVLDYIQEVKPYHVQIREFNLTYYGQDSYPGMMTDFDLPAYWNTNLTIPQYVSPVLTPYTQSSSLVESTNSDVAPDAEVWTLDPWKEWYNNYLLSIQGVTVTNGGSGYTIPPVITVTGDCVVPAEMTAIINSAGQVVGVDIINPGSGYSTTALLSITGGNGSGAIVVAQMGNELVRSIKTVIKYDRYEYNTDIVEWQPNTSYDNGTQVRYINRVWEANSSDSTAVDGPTFDITQWLPVNASSLSGVNRTMGLYVPSVNEPGLDLPLLIDGIDYPGVQVYGLGYTQDIPLDVIYESEYLDPYLGTRPTDVDVDGGAYIDTYESHAPEELIPGAEFDTLDMRVYTTPGSDWLGNGHGFPIAESFYIYDSLNPVISFAGLLDIPMTVQVFNQTSGLAITPSLYDWVNYEVTVSASDGDVIVVYVTGVGGGNQIYNNTYIGSDIGDTIIIPFPYNEIYQTLIYNGETQLILDVDYTLAINDQYSTVVTFTTTYGANDRINLATLGYAPEGQTTYSWSLPVYQTWIADGSMSVTLENSLQGTNPANLIVNVNGKRARPSEDALYTGNNSQTIYDLPSHGGYSQGLIADNDVSVYVNNVPLVLGVDFFVDAWDGSSIRTVTLTSAPAAGVSVLVSVRTGAQYWVVGNQLMFVPGSGLTPIIGDVVNIISWNDTSEQGIVTQIFVGPSAEGIIVYEGYSSTDYDAATVSDTPGSYDYSVGAQVLSNTFDIGRIITNPARILVTLNGRWLFNNYGYTVSGSTITISGSVIGSTDVVAVTNFTQSVVPGAMAFRIFQDMRGVQAVYRITPDSSTFVVQEVSSTDDIIYLNDASAVGEPDLAINIWGVIMIDGERIMYRERDTVNNTVSSLLRGTAGTGAADHTTGAVVTDLGRGNLLPAEFQNYIVSNSILADGVTTSFTAVNVDILAEDSTIRDETVEVYVGGTLQTAGYTIISDSPVTITFNTPPADGSEVTILVRRGVTWYAPGAGTASDGVPLQDTNTQAARFLRGL